jgi:hypothetical protein
MAPRAFRVLLTVPAWALPAMHYRMAQPDGVSTMTTTLTVSTVAQTATAGSGMEPVTIGTRATKDPETGKARTIPADQRTRSILIDELQVSDVPSKFQMLILDTLRDVAKAQLSSLWDADPDLRIVPASIWSVDSLLMFAAREAESKRLTKAGVALWFASSELHSLLTAKNDAKLLKQWESKIIGISAPALTYSESECEAILKTLAKFDGDSDSAMGMQLIAKLQKRLETLRTQSADVGIAELEI